MSYTKSSHHYLFDKQVELSVFNGSDRIQDEHWFFTKTYADLAPAPINGFIDCVFYQKVIEGVIPTELCVCPKAAWDELGLGEK